jgi:hypothetical protein
MTAWVRNGRRDNRRPPDGREAQSGMCLQRHTLEKNKQSSIQRSVLVNSSGTLRWGCKRGGGVHVRTVARVHHRNGVGVANRRDCAAPGQPEFCNAGPVPQFRAHVHGAERRRAAERQRRGCGWSGGGRPAGCEHAVCGDAGGRHLEDDGWRDDVDPAHRQAGRRSRSRVSLSTPPTLRPRPSSRAWV